MTLDPIGLGYWATDEREAAEEAATAFVNALRRLHVDLDDVVIVEPCDACKRTTYMLTLGSISVDEAAQYATQLGSCTPPAGP
ncbi:hypothetical protein OG204_20850 [Streptomyces sp. NBC_01387]|uniref:hypothetical protein n=1 Tax=Streptomyces sp. NBC_01387 TaxID=2903849 RepID=UPI003244E30A